METESLKQIHKLPASTQEKTHTLQSPDFSLTRWEINLISFAKELQINKLRYLPLLNKQPYKKHPFFPQRTIHSILNAGITMEIKAYVYLHSVGTLTITFELTDHFQENLKTKAEAD